MSIKLGKVHCAQILLKTHILAQRVFNDFGKYLYQKSKREQHSSEILSRCACPSYAMIQAMRSLQDLPSNRSVPKSLLSNTFHKLSNPSYATNATGETSETIKINEIIGTAGTNEADATSITYGINDTNETKETIEANDTNTTKTAHETNQASEAGEASGPSETNGSNDTKATKEATEAVETKYASETQ